MQVPWDKHVLLGELLLTDALVALEVLLKGPYVDQAETTYLEDPSHLVNSSMSDLLCWEVVYHGDWDKPITYSRSHG